MRRGVRHAEDKFCFVFKNHYKASGVMPAGQTEQEEEKRKREIRAERKRERQMRYGQTVC